jgi:serine/threonine protein kinase
LPDDIPSQIGRYKVVNELGRGGFAVVYRAFDPSVGRPVAIKILSERGRDFLTRFQNEATVAGNLRAENIVTVHEYGEHEGHPFLVMEYVEGEDLQHIISSNKPLTLLEKCKIMSQAAEGLDHAHRMNVVHRDVKPANIMVRRDGIVKIMDFGIARITRDTGEATRLTQEGYVLGTLMYMAPEQFAGCEIDALCDIFAYGVVYYELLTGRHPFKAADSRALMYKISFEEPAPISDFVPDVPTALQAVLTRILHKDRELRYPNLREVASDVQPILIELQRQRAAALLIQAQELFDKKQLDPAQTVILEALSLDPSNHTARILKENLQKQLQQRTLQPRIESLLKAGEEHLAQRRFPEALQNFEAALRFDRDSTYIQSRLENARALLDHSKKAAALVSAAQAEFKGRNLSSAYRSVSEALRHDPENPEAKEFLKTVQDAMERQQKDLRVEDAVHKAQGLMLLRSYDEAVASLTALGPDAEDARVQKILAGIRAEKLERERKQRLQTEMAAATELLRNRRPAEAAQRLVVLKSEFPDNTEVDDLLAYVRKEVEVEARTAAVQEFVAKAAALAQNNDFDGATAILEEALRKYRGENTLIRLLSSTLAAKADWERRQAVQTTIRECEQFRSQRRFAEAIEHVEATLREYGEDRALLELQGLLEAEWTQHRRAEAVRKAAEQARKLLTQNRPGDALQFLRQSVRQYPDESEIAALLDRAVQEVRAQERAKAVNEISREAGVHAKAHDFDRALATIDRGLKAWLNDDELLRLREELEKEKAVWDKQRAIREALERARQFAVRKQFGDAQRVIAAALEKYPGEQDLTESQSRTAREAEQHERKERAQAVASEIRLLLSRERLDEALEVLKEAEHNFPGEADLQSVAQQAANTLAARQRAEAIERTIRQSDELAAGQQFDGARQLLERGLELYPADPALERQLKAVTVAAADWERMRAVQRIVAEAKALAKDERYDEALTLLGSSPVYSPSLLEAQQQLTKEREQFEHRKAIAEAATAVKAMLDRGRTDTAIKMLRELATQYPGEPPWEPLMAQAQEQLAARKLAEERQRAVLETVDGVEALAGESRFQEALDLLDRALQQYSSEASLLELRQRIAKAEEQHRRDSAVANAAKTAQGLLDQGLYDDALRELRESCAQYTGEQVLVSLLSQAEEQLAARARRNQAVVQAEALLRKGREEDAVNLLRPHAGRFPSDAELNALLSRAQAGLDLRRRREAIEKVAVDGLALAAAGGYDRALAMLDRGLRDWPGEQRLLDARDSVHSAQVASQRQAAKTAALRLLSRLSREGRFAQGVEQADSFLREYPGDVEVLERRKKLRMSRMLADAESCLANGSPAEALRILEEGAADYRAERKWAALTKRARAEAEALARAAAIELKCSEARAKADAGDFEAALHVLDEALAKWPDERVLNEARTATLSAKALQDRRRAVQNALAECERLAREGRLAAALQLAEGVLHDFPDDQNLSQLRERLRNALDEQNRHRRREHDLKELRELGEWAGPLSGAVISDLFERATRMVARHPGDHEIEGAGAQAIRHLEDIENATTAIARNEFAVALEICARRLARQRDNGIFKELQDEAERGRKLAYLADLERRVADEADLAVRARLLQEGAEWYPEEQWITAELRLTLNKLSLVTATLERARACEVAGELDQALDQCNRVGAIHSRQPGLDAEIQRLQAARDRARVESTARWAGHVEEQIQAGELARARDLLRQALTEFPDAPSLQELGRRVDALRQKARQARSLVSQAQAACEGGNFDECRSCLRQAFQLGEHDAALRKLVLSKLIELAEAALESGWRSAEALAAEAVSLQPGFAIPEQLLLAIAERKRDSLVDSALAKAEQLANARDWRAGLAEVERALQETPGDLRLSQMHEVLLARIEEQRQSLATELQGVAEAARRETEPARLKLLKQRASSIAAEVRGDAGLSPLATQTVREITSHERRLRIDRFRGRIATYRREIGGIAAAVVIALGAGIVARELWTFEVKVKTSPPGAAVTAGNQTCAISPCRFLLRRGDYVVRAQLSGYRPAGQRLKVEGAGLPPLNLVLERELLASAGPPVGIELLKVSLRVRDAIPGTTIAVDGGPPVAVQPDGSLNLEVDAGTHRVEVARKGNLSMTLPLQCLRGQPCDLDLAKFLEKQRQDALALEKQRRDALALEKQRQDALALEKQRRDALALEKQRQDALALEKQRQDALALEKQRQDALALEKQRQDALAFEKQRRDAAALEKQRRDALALEKQRQDALALEKQRQDALALEKQRQDALEKDRKDIRDTLKRYEAAYKDKNINAIRSINPMIPPDLFKPFISIELTLNPREAPSISENIATVQCDQVMVAVDQRGTHKFPSRTPTVTLIRKPTGGWVIDSIK